jgi:MerR family transcriptional regulator, copper efflux regulator
LKAYRAGVTTYRVAELAERVGLPPSTVRFYEQTGLLPARRSESGYRLFDDQAAKRIQVITTGKGLGLRLEEIRDLLQVWEDGLCRDVRQRLRPMVLNRIADAEQRAAEIDAFIKRLRQASSLIDGPVPSGRCGPGCGIMPDPHPAAIAPPAVELTARRRGVESAPPIACALTADDQASRIGEWRRLLGQAGDSEPVNGGLAFRFPAGLAGQVGELAAAEQQCCPFFEFTLHLAAGELRFEVRVPEHALPLLADVFGTDEIRVQGRTRNRVGS